jgi:hypothetical protein
VNRQLLELLRVFGTGLVKSGMLTPAKTAVREAGEGAVRAATKAPSYRQGSLLPALQSTQPGRSIYGPKISPADVDYRAMLRPSPRAAEVPSLPKPPNRDQLSLFEAGPAPVPSFKTTPMQGPVSLTAQDLYATDPGTYKAIDALARRATAYYGKPVTVDDLVSPGGTKFLRNFEENLKGASSLVRSPGGAKQPPAGAATVDLLERAGAVVPSSKGALDRFAQEGIGAARGLDDIIDVDVRELANAVGGVRQLDLGKIGLAVGIPGGLAAAFAAGRMSAPSAPEVPVQTPMGPTTESADAGTLINDPQAAQSRQMSAAQQLAESMTPGARAVIPEAQYRGADGQTVITTRGEDEALRAAKQQYTKPQAALRDYYTKREQYANFPGNKAEIVSELAKRGILDSPELIAWAGANPTLAYELLRKATGSTTLPSQQVPQQTQKVVTAPAGSNNANNMMGNVAASAEATVDGTQGATELRSFTTPQLVDEIRQLDPALIYALQGRNLI